MGCCFVERCCLITAYSFKLNNARYCIQNKVNKQYKFRLKRKDKVIIPDNAYDIQNLLIRTSLRLKCVNRPFAYFATSH